MLWSDNFKDVVIADFLVRVNALLGDPATLVFRTGSAPASTLDADTGTLIATCAFDPIPFQDPLAGVCVANAIASDTSTGAGTVGYFRAKSDGGVTIFQGTSGESGEDFVWDESTFASGDTAQVDFLSIAIAVGP